MPQAEPNLQENYDQFIQHVRETKLIWGLHSDSDGWAHSESNEYEDTDVLLFWSDREKAAVHQNEEWADHTPTEIDFDDFIDSWLQGMDADGTLAGPNWDENFCGLEVEPKDLADRLLAEQEDEE